ncbi:hypothetical protein LJC56_11550, partial [Christensenellaceae bacterium OttesenSCG-928-K19]|nr:hypothetical protein [Christensenellaceae bacterium OttesenSCG-928-K19]
MKKRIFWILIALALAALPACSAPFLDMNIAAEAPVAPAMQTQPAVEAPFVEEPVETPVPDMPATAPEPAGNVYTDDMLGFEITLP